jgi:hypothetical protein
LPGTPATSTRFAAPRFANADAVDFAGQVNSVTDKLDSEAARAISGTLAVRPAAPASWTFYYATDRVGQVDEVSVYVGGAWRNVPNGLVTAAEIEAQQAWQTLTFSGGKATGSLKYYKDSLGTVHVITNGTVTLTLPWTAGDAAGATMPAGYRPGQDTYFGFKPPGISSYALKVSSAGVITMADTVGGSGVVGAVFVSGEVTWRAEN